MTKIAVTGMGVVSPLGLTPDSMWDALLEGVNGIRCINRVDPKATPGVQIAAEVPEFDVTPYVRNRKLLKAMTRPGKYLVAATHMALSDAGLLDPRVREGLSTSVVVGLGSHTPEHYEMVPWEERPPLWYLETFPNLTLSQVSINFDLRDDFNVLLNACASGTKALLDGATQIRIGNADIAIVGAAESKISQRHLAGFCRLGALSKSPDPDAACRPFDRGRDGFVMGEGAGILILEEYERAKRRGAQIHALISGGGCSMDAGRLTDPDIEGRGLARAMQRAFKNAGVDASKVGYVNAHGTSTVANDKSESLAIRSAFGSHSEKLVVNSTKSMMGHATAASGAMEAIVCIKSLQHQKVHMTRNFESGCEVCSLDYVPNAARDVRLRYAMSNSAGLGGLNSSVIFAAA